MKHYKIPESVLVGIRQYLGTRPYDEVAQGIRSIEQLEPIKEDEGASSAEMGTKATSSAKPRSQA